MNRVGTRPQRDESTSEYHWSLIDQLDGSCIMTTLVQQQAWFREVMDHLSTEQVDVVHSPYSWTVRQVVEHCVDAERVFGYRILRFAAGDDTTLPGWDQDQYADRRFGLGNFVHLVEEMECLRRANIILLRRLVPSCWDCRGLADDVRVTVRALAWITAGHLRHHLMIIQQRCGLDLMCSNNEGTNA